MLTLSRSQALRLLQQTPDEDLRNTLRAIARELRPSDPVRITIGDTFAGEGIVKRAAAPSLYDIELPDGTVRTFRTDHIEHLNDPLNYSAR